jgi:hypothetical protein
MASPRPTPFDLAFGEIADARFPAIRAALHQSGQDPRDRDRFFMLREVITLMRDLRPEEGLGQGIDQLAALLHQAYLFWNAGSNTVSIPPEHLARLLSPAGVPPAEHREEAPEYIQFPAHRVWAEAIPGQPAEPLDGCFLHQATDPGVLRVLGIFGVYAERPGFSAVEVSGQRPRSLTRHDRSPLFTPVLPGGVAAGLYSLLGEAELLELGWRAFDYSTAPVEADSWRA